MRKLLTFVFILCCANAFAQLDNVKLGMSIKGSQTLPSTITVTSSETLAVGDPVFIDVTIGSTNRTAVTGLDVTNGRVAISGNGARIIYGLNNNTRCYEWNGSSYSLVAADSVPGVYIAANLAISSDGSIYAANSLVHGNAVAYRRNNEWYVSTVPTNASAPMALTADGNRLIYATNGSSGYPYLTTLVWSGTALQKGNNPDTDYDQITSIAVTPDGEYLVCGRSVAPYIVTYKWNSGNARYELMTAPDTIASYFVQSMTLSDDGQILYVAQYAGSANLYKIHRYDYSMANGRYELTKTAPLYFQYLTKIKAIGHGRWLFALYRSGGSYKIKEVNGETLISDTTSKTMADFGAYAIYDFDLATNENDYAYYANASYYRLGAGEVYPKFTAVKASNITETIFGADGTFQQSCGYITDSTKQFGASAKILLSDPSLAPYLE